MRIALTKHARYHGNELGGKERGSLRPHLARRGIVELKRTFQHGEGGEREREERKEKESRKYFSWRVKASGARRRSICGTTSGHEVLRNTR